MSHSPRKPLSMFILWCVACTGLISGCGRSAPPTPVAFINGSRPDLVIILEDDGRAVIESVPIGASGDCIELSDRTHRLLRNIEGEWRSDGQGIEIWGADWSLRGHFVAATIGIDWSELNIYGCNGDSLALFARE